MSKTEKGNVMGCTCISEMNAKLAEHNGALVTTMFSNPVRTCVEVYQVKTGRGTKKPPKALASYCPFCGAQYGDEQSEAA